MQRKSLAVLLKAIVLFILLIGATLYAYMIPAMLSAAAETNEILAENLTAVKLAVLPTALPIALALFAFWGICTDIARDDSFSEKNGKRLMLISFCAIADTAYCFIFCVYLALSKMLRPLTFFATLIVILLGIALAVASALLSHLTQKAKSLKDEADLTV